MPRRRAFVALAASSAVLVTVVGLGTALGAADPLAPQVVEDQMRAHTPASSDWMLSPGSMALLAASGIALLKARRE
ncbi:MAG: hypothetical protein KF912_04595 [Phycisphaeraceae bacterium]|nr:hypothetical protein [Phycisphaeraceae bacterium]QYK47270.1 MAG: hypothetical protein KF838_10815 [Phycisphaeraceae bacterium]